MKNFQKATPLDHPKRKSHRLILGPFQPDLEDELLTLVRAKKEGDPLRPVVALVGSNLLGLYLRRLFVLRGFDHFNLRLLTLLEFAGVIAGETLNLEGLRPLPKFGDLVTIRALAERMETGYFQPIARRRGFQKALAATFRDLADGGVKKFPAGKDRKLEELQSLYQLHRAGVDKGFYDQADILFRAAREIHRFPEIFRSEELILYGFYDFTQGQEQLIRACGRRLNLDAFMPWRETPAFAYASSTFELYKDLGFKIQTRRDPEKEKRSFLQQVQRDLFASERKEGNKGNDPEGGSIRIIAAPGESHEIREIVREILRLARDEDIPFHEMAILLRSVDVYGPLIQQAFQDLQIPFYFQGGLPLSRTPEGKSALLLLDLAGGNLRRRAVMEFLTFAPVAWKRFFAEEPSPSQWDLLSREAGIVEGRDQWEGKLAALMRQGEEEEWTEGKGGGFFAEEARGFWGFLNNFFSSLDRFPRKGTWQVLADAFLHLLEAYFEESETREAVFDALRDLAPLDALTREVDIFLFREIAAEALEEKTLRLGSFQKNGVCVSDLMPARGLSFRVVIIPGLVERAFPAPARQDPLLLDHERRAMNEALGETGRIPLKRNRFQEERLLFALAVASAREKLILSYPRLDPTSGRERIPSFFLLRVGEALLGEPLDYSRLETLPGYRRVALSRLAPDDPVQAISEEEFDLAQVGRALQRKDQGEAAYLKRLFPVLERAERLARLRWGFRAFTEYDGCLKSPRALQILRDRFALSGKVLSPTRLETYASCPFNYFLSEILSLRPLPSPEEIRRLEPLERGKTVHELLCRFYPEVLKQAPGSLKSERISEYERILVDLAARVFAETESRGITGAPLLWELDREEILQDLKTFLKSEVEESEDWIPTHFEINFGREPHFTPKSVRKAPISLTLEGKSSVAFRGRIDRVDFSRDGSRVRVIDYKTGKVEGPEDGFGGGTRLQLPLYLMASGQIWKQINLEKSLAQYVSVSRKGRFRRLFFHGENWPDKEEKLRKITQTISRGILEGTFFPLQQDERSCAYCDFKNICERGTSVLFQRKKDDPRAREFLEMREIE